MPDETPSPPRFLTVEQAALHLNVGQPLIRGLLKTGELRGFQLGARNIWRIGLGDIQNYIDNAYMKTAERIASGDIDDRPEPVE